MVTAFALWLGASACFASVSDEPALQSENAALAPAPGSVDTTFTNGCKNVSARFTSVDAVHAVVQADGKIVVGFAGRNLDGYSVFALARYTAAGALDTSFGTSGYASTVLNANTVYVELNALTLATDGKIVAAGTLTYTTTDQAGVLTEPVVFAAVRYSSNGVADASFGQGGKVTTAVLGKSDRAYAVVVQPDGKIILGGQARQKLPGYNGTDISALARFTTGGALDSSFGQGGLVTTSGSGIRALGLEANGNIFAASPAIQRFSATGAPIATAFSGTLSTISAGQRGSFAIENDGKRVVGGSVRSVGSKHAHIPTMSRVAVNGGVEFVTGGYNYGSSVNNASADTESVLIESTGRIIAGGLAPLPGGEYGFGLIAINANGTIDTSFGGPLGLFTRITGQDMLGAIVQQSDGKLIAAGACSGSTGLALQRYIGP